MPNYKESKIFKIVNKLNKDIFVSTTTYKYLSQIKKYHKQLLKKGS